MRIAAIAAALCVAVAGAAHSDPDPLNWCLPTPAPGGPPLSEPMQQAFAASAPNFATATFRAGQVVATLQLQPLAPRILSAARPELGLEQRMALARERCPPR